MRRNYDNSIVVSPPPLLKEFCPDEVNIWAIIIREERMKSLEKLLLGSAVRAEKEIRAICGEMGRKLASDTDAVCPVEFTASLLRLLQSRSCGKCVPCLIGLGELADLLDQVLDGAGQAETLERIEGVSRYGFHECGLCHRAGGCPYAAGHAACISCGLSVTSGAWQMHCADQSSSLCERMPCPCGYSRIYCAD